MRSSIPAFVVAFFVLLGAPPLTGAPEDAPSTQRPTAYKLLARGNGFVPFKAPPGHAAGWTARGPDGRPLHVAKLAPAAAREPGEPTQNEGGLVATHVVLVQNARGGRKGKLPIRLAPSETPNVQLHGTPGGSSTPAGPAASALPARRVFDQDLMFAQVAAGLPQVYAGPHSWWHFTRLTPGEARTVFFGTASAKPGHAQTITAQITPTHRGQVALQAWWGDVDLGVRRTQLPVEGVPGTARPLTWRIAGKDVPTNTRAEFVLQDVSPKPPARPARDVSDGRGMVWIESLAVHGTTTTHALRRLRRYELHLGGTLISREVLVPGVAPLVAAVTPSGTLLPLQLEAVTQDGESDKTTQTTRVRFGPGEIPDGTQLWVQSRQLAQAPVPMPDLGSPLAHTRDVDHLIVATQPLVDEAKRLAAHRRAGGIQSAVVSADMIWSAYGAGEAHPDLLSAFLRERAAASERPLRYLLLAGDATLDRGDLVSEPTIPTRMTRTMYNGATASDQAYVRDPAAPFTGPSVGRLPFSKPATLKTFVDRLIRYETEPPAAATRRLLRFVTSEGRFGALIDGLIERIFRNVLADYLPPAYEIEITFASQSSPFLWPPREFGDKVLSALNEGSLFYTYIGHGWAHGFDQLHVGRERFPILTTKDLPRVDIQGVPPVMLILACTTARFDYPRSEGIGELLLQDPEGPIAYWGATRICHPAANSLVGYRLAARMGNLPQGTRLGDLMRESWRDVTDPERNKNDPPQKLLRGGLGLFLGGVPTRVLAREGREMFALLGDPATSVAFPQNDLSVQTHVEEVAETDPPTPATVNVRVTGPFKAGTEVHVSLERLRNRTVHTPTRIEDVLDPTSAPAIRANHATMNDWALLRRTVLAEDGGVDLEFPLPKDRAGLLVKAWVRTKTDIHQGAALLERD